MSESDVTNSALDQIGSGTHDSLEAGTPVILQSAQHLVSASGENLIIQDVSGKDEAGSPTNGTILTPSSIQSGHVTLQGLLTTPVGIDGNQACVVQPEAIQIITVNNASELLGAHGDSAGRLWQVIAQPSSQDIATVGIIPISLTEASELDQKDELSVPDDEVVDASTVPQQDINGLGVMGPPPTPATSPHPSQQLPADCPGWATRLYSCELIGSYYRGYVESEVELDLLLTYHKQQTQSYWGTRQSPSPARPSTRLMWKSQYVPFDGIPFLNSGSRAVVMECQYGPRRKGSHHKKLGDMCAKGSYKQTCPARIYVKKVRKYPEFAVDLKVDKKTLKNSMDRAFQDLKHRNLDGMGQDRFYVQLPTESAHEYHAENTPPPTESLIGFESKDLSSLQRIHPQIVQKIREIVAAGETRVYIIRKLLRIYVIRELFLGNDNIPERHDLTYFPTVNDIKNHIHQALKDIETGTLPVTAATVNVEIVSGSDDMGENSDMQVDQLMWHNNMTIAETPTPETVTVTLTQNPGDDGRHIISKIETHLSDGTTQISTSLTPETAQLLSKLDSSLLPVHNLVTLQGLSQQDGQEFLNSAEQQLLSVKTEPLISESFSTALTSVSQHDLGLNVSMTSNSPTAMVTNAQDSITVSKHSVSDLHISIEDENNTLVIEDLAHSHEQSNDMDTLQIGELPPPHCDSGGISEDTHPMLLIKSIPTSHM